MTQTLDARRLDPGAADRTTTRIGAGLGIVSIVLVATGFAVAAATETTIASSPSEVAAFYTGAGLARTLTGGIVEMLGLLLFLPFAAVLTGRRAGRWRLRRSARPDRPHGRDRLRRDLPGARDVGGCRGAVAGPPRQPPTPSS